MSKLKVDLGFGLKRLDLIVQGLVNTRFLGKYKSAFKGIGLEFEDYRRYNPGTDDASLIDWKASKRVNQILVKEFVEERNLEVIFLVDVSSKMLTGSAKKLKAEYIAELVSSLSRSIADSGDSVGLILFSDKIVKFLPPQLGVKQFYSITKNLSNISYYSGLNNLNNAIDFVFKNGESGSLVILVSDFICEMNFEENLKLASKKFDFMSFMVRDNIDMVLPAGVGEVVVSDPYSGETLLIDPMKIRKEYAKESNAQMLKIKNLMKKAGADFLYLQTDRPFVKSLIEFFKIRESKWR